jgi:cytochrome P450 family 4
MMFTLIIIFVAFLCLWYYFKNREFIELASKLPGPKGLEVLQGILEALKVKPSDTLSLVTDLHKKYGRVVRTVIGPHCLVFLCDPSDVEKILLSKKCLQKPDQYKVFESFVDTGLLTSSGSKWHSRRKILTPAFHFKILERFVPIFEKHSEMFVENLRERINCYFDVCEPLMMSALNIICGE